MRVAIVTQAFEAYYLKGLKRLRDSLSNVNAEGIDLMAVSGEGDHKKFPYGFKVKAMREAEQKGYDIAIWVDSNAHFKKHPQPIIDRCIEQGYWISTMGWNVGQWCSDAALPKLDLTREEAWDITMVGACVYALKFNTKLAQHILEYMEKHEDALPGAWTNKNGEVSKTPGVLGHRHDQTVLSVAAYRFNLKIDKPPCLLAYANNDGKYEEQAVVFKEGIL